MILSTTFYEDIMFAIRMTILAALFATAVPTAIGQNAQEPLQQQQENQQQEQAAREQRLADHLNGVRLIGKFTVDGVEEDAKTESYTISKCEKLPEPDMYQITARITYGEVDSEFPLKIKILWAGSTPVITLDNFWIPGMGTFGARVLLLPDRYAGTWQHDEVGGHMFGKIEKIADETP
jgi:hypothetical protein